MTIGLESGMKRACTIVGAVLSLLSCGPECPKSSTPEVPGCAPVPEEVAEGATTPPVDAAPDAPAVPDVPDTADVADAADAADAADVADVGLLPDSSGETEEMGGTGCGDGLCDPASGERCGTCPEDCICQAGMACGQAGACCWPGECGSLGMECGIVVDGCGDELDCGACPGEKECVDGVCTDGQCKPELVRALSGDVQAVAISGTLAVVGTERGILVLDMSDPTTPVVQARMESKWRVLEVWIDGTYAYVLTRSPLIPIDEWWTALKSELRILDLTDPTAPVDLGTSTWYASQSGTGATDLTVGNGVAYLIEDGYGPYRIDVSDPAQPGQPIPFFSKDNPPPGWHYPSDSSNLALDGGRLYLLEGTMGVLQFDVSDPEVPVLTGEWSFYWGHGGVAVVGDLLVAAAYDWLLMFDVNAPGKEPVLASQVCGGTEWKELRAEGAMLHGVLEDGNATLLVDVDLEDPSVPFCLPGPLVPLCKGFAASDGVELIAAEDSGLLVFGAGPGAGSEPLGAVQLPEGKGLGGTVDGQTGYTATSGGLGVWDVRNPTEPVSLSVVGVPEGVAGVIGLGRHAILLTGGGASLQTGGAVGLVDVSDPWNAALIDVIELPCTGKALTRVGSAGYFLCHGSPWEPDALLHVAVSDTDRLEVTGLPAPPPPLSSLTAAGGLLVGGFSWNKSVKFVSGFDLLAVDAGMPAKLGQFAFEGGVPQVLLAAAPTRVFLGGTKAAFGNPSPAVLVDISDPSHPETFGTAMVEGLSIALTADRVWIPGTGGAFVVLDTTPGGELPSLAGELFLDDQFPPAGPSAITLSAGYAFLFGDELAVVDVHGCWGGE